MKYILILLSVLVLGSCDDEKAAIQKKRYFFVGYSAMDDQGETNGNLLYKLDTIPTNDKLKDDIYQMLYCERPYKREDIVIVSFSEFKDSMECIKFRASLDASPIPVCDTNSFIIIK